ncbi:MAG TPA: hypothetical protein VFC00_17995 [Micromonosporaceae bacterium]|nr:hypothetical protein [Micromonosporaceae bacterium]
MTHENEAPESAPFQADEAKGTVAPETLTVSVLEAFGLGGLSRLWLTCDGEGCVVVAVDTTRGDTPYLEWLAEQSAAVLLGGWVAHLIDDNPALETHLGRLLLTFKVPTVPVAHEPVARALFATAQAADHD